MEEVTILTKGQVKSLEVLKKYGKEAEATDLYILQNGYVSKKHGYVSKLYGENIGSYWAKVPKDFNLPGLVYKFHDEFHYGSAKDSVAGVRPVIPLSQINNPTKLWFHSGGPVVDGIQYGEYPQSVVDETLENELEGLYNKGQLLKTNRIYTIGFNDSYSCRERGKETVCQEYEFQNNRYIRLKSAINLPSNLMFSNGRSVLKDKTYWVKVEKIKWLIDEKENIAISKNILTNMAFSPLYDSNNYETSDVKEFLEKYFIKEIKQDRESTRDFIDMKKIDELVELVSMIYDEKEKVKKLCKK